MASWRGEGQDEGGLREAINRIWYNASPLKETRPANAERRPFYRIATAQPGNRSPRIPMPSAALRRHRAGMRPALWWERHISS